MKKLAILMSVFMLVALTAGFALAEEKKAAKMEVLTGQVVAVDTAAGTIVIKVGDKEQTLKAEAKLLEGIAAGDKVSLEKAGDDVKSLKKAQ